jgi:hypothetical protein
VKCPECGVEVNEQISRCHSCHAQLIKKEPKAPSRLEKLGIRTKRGLPFLFLIGYLLLLFVITFPLYSMFASRQKTEQLRDNLTSLQEYLEEFADKFDSFPEDINQLALEGIIGSFPRNPYHDRAMKPRHVGQSFAGDFTYIPLYNQNGRVMGYVLVGYGPDPDKGQDIFTEGNDYSRLMQFATDPDGIPDGVIIFLHGKRGTHEA